MKKSGIKIVNFCIVVFFTLSAMCFAQIVFIDPVNGNDSWTGSTGWRQGTTTVGPWKTLANLEDTASWNIARIKRGTTLHVTQKTIFYNIDGKTIEAYGDVSAAQPIITSYRTITSGWQNIGNNVWEYDLGTTYWNPGDIIGFGSLTEYGVRVWFADNKSGTGNLDWDNAPHATGEWDNWQGNASKSSRIYVYAPSDPAQYYGTIYYQTEQHPVFLLRSARNFVLRYIDFKFGYSPLAFVNGGDWQDNYNITINSCSSKNMYHGFKIKPASACQYRNLTIKNCVIRNCLCTGITLGGYIKSSYVQNNTIEKCGLSCSIAGIYINDLVITSSGSEIHVSDNTVKETTYGNYWPVDGHGIMLEHGAMYALVYRNKVTKCYKGLHDNSGSITKWYNNLVRECDFGFFSSDANDVCQADIKIYNNSFIQCGGIGYQGFPQGDSVMVLQGKETPVFEVKNNIIYAKEDTVDGICTGYGDICLTEKNNCFWNTLDEIVCGNTVLVKDSSSILAWPKIDWADSCSLLEGSPCVDCGTGSVGGICPGFSKDFRYLPRWVGQTIDIGANELQ